MQLNSQSPKFCRESFPLTIGKNASTIKHWVIVPFWHANLSAMDASGWVESYLYPSGEVAPQLQPLTWLLGKWRSVEGQAVYPTMKPFPYQEELEFFQTGQPNIQFK